MTISFTNFFHKASNYLNVNIRIKTMPSRPELSNRSSSDGSHALFIQPAEGKSLSRLKSVFCSRFLSETKRGAYTVRLPGCFLRIEYKVKNRKQRPRLIPTDVRRAERIIIHSFLIIQESTQQQTTLSACLFFLSCIDVWVTFKAAIQTAHPLNKEKRTYA